MAALDNVTTALLASGSRQSGHNGNWTCPTHDDHQPSLSVTNCEGRVLVHCHAGCGTEAILEHLGLSMHDLFDEPRTTECVRQVAAIYEYADEHGAVLSQVVRYDPKDFRQRRPDGNGGWIWNLVGTRRVLYRLPEVIEAAAAGGEVFVAEGEKDVEAIRRTGAIATCNPGGAGKWRREYTDSLIGAGLVKVVADNDETGISHAQHVAAELAAVAIPVELLRAAHGKDAADHLGAGYGLDDFLSLDADPDEADVPDLAPAQRHDVLGFVTAAELAAEVDGCEPLGWLARRVWPADAYGVIAAEQKAGKTWAEIDLAVATATGKAWLGLYPIDRRGRVVLFLGEGGKRKMLRRLRAVCAAYGVRLEDLPLELCFRAPRLTSGEHMAAIAGKLARHEDVVLVIIDPLYLAAQGAKASSLFDMGTLLERVQLVIQDAGAALVVVHHWNQTGTGKGVERMSGAGPAEWGRVLVSVAVRSKWTDPVTKETRVTLDWAFSGDEIPDTTCSIRRRVWADDPDDLGSALHYVVEPVDRNQEPSGPLEDEKPAVRRVYNMLDSEVPKTVRDLGDALANDGTGIPLRPRTIQDALARLATLGHARHEGTTGTSLRWVRIGLFDTACGVDLPGGVEATHAHHTPHAGQNPS